jgi:hypothetical protein
VFFSRRVVEVRTDVSEEITASGFSASHKSDWSHLYQLPHITDTFISSQPLQHPPEPDSVTLKMETLRSFETSEHIYHVA